MPEGRKGGLREPEGDGEGKERERDQERGREGTGRGPGERQVIGGQIRTVSNRRVRQVDH